MTSEVKYLYIIPASRTAILDSARHSLRNAWQGLGGCLPPHFQHPCLLLLACSIPKERGILQRAVSGQAKDTRTKDRIMHAYTAFKVLGKHVASIAAFIVDHAGLGDVGVVGVKNAVLQTLPKLKEAAFS